MKNLQNYLQNYNQTGVLKFAVLDLKYILYVLFLCDSHATSQVGLIDRFKTNRYCH